MGSHTIWDMASAELESLQFARLLNEGWEPFSVVPTSVSTPSISLVGRPPLMESRVVLVAWFKRPHDFDAENAKEVDSGETGQQ